MRRVGWRLLAVALALGAAACATPVEIRNAAPLVTQIGSVTPIDGGLMVVYWLLDHEEDPVDVTAAYAVGAQRCATARQRLAESAARGRPLDPEDLDLSPVVDMPGLGHHLSGLSSAADYPGAPHELAWSTAGLADDDELCLYLLPDDRNGALGDALLSPVFRLADGYTASATP